MLAMLLISMTHIGMGQIEAVHQLDAALIARAATDSDSAVRASALAELPDAPEPALSSAAFAGDLPFGLSHSDAERAKIPALRTDKYILPGQFAPKLSAHDKVELGLIHSVSVYAIMGWFVSSGYTQVTNGSPNYGVDRGAYGQRLGAAALRGFSNEILRDSIMAPVFHQDPRYYKMGPKRNFAVRTAYAVSRIVVTRNDEGHLVPNYTMITGNLMGAALTNAYYPDVNRGLGQTARSFGSFMYGSAFSFVAGEFLTGALEAVHLKGDRD